GGIQGRGGCRGQLPRVSQASGPFSPAANGSGCGKGESPPCRGWLSRRPRYRVDAGQHPRQVGAGYGADIAAEPRRGWYPPEVERSAICTILGGLEQGSVRADILGSSAAWSDDAC